MKQILLILLFSAVTATTCWGQFCYDPKTDICFTEPEKASINPYLYNQIWQDIDQIWKNLGGDNFHLLPPQSQADLVLKVYFYLDNYLNQLGSPEALQVLSDLKEMIQRAVSSDGCDIGIQIKPYNNLKKYNLAKGRR